MVNLLTEIKVKRRNRIESDVPLKMKIVFKMSMCKHQKLTQTEIAKLCNIPNQLVVYHLPALVESGVVLKDNKKYWLQDHFYHIEQYTELLMPLIQAISETIEGDYTDPEYVLLMNLDYFLANLSVDIID